MAFIHPDSKLGRGWSLTKSSWRVLVLDKELVLVTFISVLLCVAMVMGALTVSAQFLYGETHNFNSISQIAIGYAFIVLVTVISTFVTASIVAGATERFRGGDPTLRSCITAALRKFYPLLIFGLFMGSVGYVLQLLEDRLPVAGSIAVWLVDASWAIANFFSIPAIVLSDKNIMPLTATKRSVQIIKKAWGESIVAQATVGIVGTVAVISFVAISSILLMGIASIASGLATGIGFGLAGIGLLTILVVFSTLNGIVKAALYHYAMTGKPPAQFDKKLLQTSMTPKKAEKIFT